MPPVPDPPPRDLWDDLFPLVPHLNPPGALIMLRVIAYDISEPRRWQRIVTLCEDFGVRVQYSLFECWLEDAEFEKLWTALQAEMDPATDRLIAYHLDSPAARRRQGAGQTLKGVLLRSEAEPATTPLVEQARWEMGRRESCQRVNGACVFTERLESGWRRRWISVRRGDVTGV